MKNIYLLLILTFALSCKKQNQKTEPLALSLPMGFQQAIVYQSEATLENQQQLMETNQVDYKIDSISKDGIYYFTGKIIKMSANMSFQEEQISYSSDMQNSTDLIGSEVTKYANKEYTFAIDKYGNFFKAPKFKDGTEAENGLLDSFNFIPFKFSQTPIYEGYKWTDTSTNPILKSQLIETTFLVDSIGSKEIKISSIGKIKGIENYTKDSYLTSKYVLDRKTKALISAEKQLDFSNEKGKAEFKIYPKSF